MLQKHKKSNLSFNQILMNSGPHYTDIKDFIPVLGDLWWYLASTGMINYVAFLVDEILESSMHVY